jgi:hypothetical protein
MADNKYLLGRGELLTEIIPPPKRGGEKAQLYTYAEAKRFIKPQIQAAIEQFSKLPQKACPDDYVVSKLILNPAYIAKSYFPARFLQTAELVSIGSHNTRITPKKWSKRGAPKESSTIQLFVAGKRKAFRSLPALLEKFKSTDAEAQQFSEIEQFSTFSAQEKIRTDSTLETEVYEIGLQLIPGGDNSGFIKAFMDYVRDLGGIIDKELQFFVSSLWFLPVTISRDHISKIAEFSFVRVIRPMPKLRSLRPLMRTTGVTLATNMPDADAVSSEPKVAILDGGLPDTHPIGRWVKRYELMDPAQNSIQEGQEHGLGVTSAYLFGPIRPGVTAERPYAPVSHFRVLDEMSDQEDQLELYRTLGFIEEILLSRQFQFINLSLGPDLPIEDTDIHAWTSLIDNLLEDGETILTVAAGNNGQADRASGNARIQVPSDCVNALAVGACDIIGNNGWKRAAYSAIGPGRSPGVIKPDLLTFGGSGIEYFHHIRPGLPPAVVPNLGTSFAAPYLLRTAVGTRAVLGPDLSPLAIKALLVHCADKAGHDSREVGWGRIPTSLPPIINCPDGMVRIVYQGQLLPGKYLRAKVPVPSGGIQGKIGLKATFCYACPTSPQDASSYTKAGLEITFRPDLSRKRSKSEQARSRSFFDMGKYRTEQERRVDFGKWETVISDQDNMLGSTLKEPVFDIHYNAREGNTSTQSATAIKYALVITINAPKHSTIYSDVLRAYSNVLVPLQPQITLPITV